MGNWFTRALDKVTPWRRGGEVQRDQESQQRKRRKEEEEQVQRTQAPQTQRPNNRINQGKTIGGQDFQFGTLNNTRQVSQPNEVEPDLGKPKQSFFNKVRDQFDANTEADQYRRAEGNRLKGENKEVDKRDSPNLFEKATVPARSALRVTTGIGQGATGLYDLVTPGKGTSRATKKLNSMAENIDRDAREQGLETPYKVGNVVGEAASYLTPGILTKGGKVGNITSKGASKVDDIIRLGQNPNRVRRLVSDAAKEFLDPVNLEQEARLTGRYLGQDSARGREITPRVVAENALQSLAGAFLAPIARGAGRFITRGRGEEVLAPAIEQVDNLLSNADVEDIMRTDVPVGQNIPINMPVDEGLPVNVRNLNEPAPLIREIGGDASNATPNPLVQRRADDLRIEQAFDANRVSRPTQREIEGFEGITSRNPEAPYSFDSKVAATTQDKLIDDYANQLRSMGEGNGVAITPDGRRVSNNYRDANTKGKRMTKAQWREEAERQLRSGEGDPALQQPFNDAVDPDVQSLLARGEQSPTQEGRPIQVKEAKSIPVQDRTDIPVMPETPGTVRATRATDPVRTQTEAVASTPTVKTPAQLPSEVQEVLDNPKQYNKRQVASARNQAKLARQNAKAQEQVTEAYQKAEVAKTSRGADSDGGFASTGEYGRGRRGNAYEKASNQAERDLGRKEMADRSTDDLLDELATKDSFSPGDKRRVSAAKENLMKTDPENYRNNEVYKVLDRLEKAGRTQAGQDLALIPKVIRKSASGDELAGRWERKLGKALDDPSKITDGDWKQIVDAEDKFTLARDRSYQLEEQFKRTGSEADFNAWEKAFKEAQKADTDAKFTEAAVAQRVLKGQKGATATKVLDELKKEADVNTMDIVTANMLSGTGTGVRNLVGTELAGIENRVGANLRAKITKGIFNEDVGGFDRKAARIGRKTGTSKLITDVGRRGAIGGKNPLEWAKNWSTTINSAGESSLQSQIYSRLGKYYKNQFDAQGVSGKELDRRMRHALLTDPDEMGRTFTDAAMKSSGLSGLFEKGQKIEKGFVDWIGRGTDNKTAQTASKLLMRLAVGFPTATGNFVYQSGKRLALGLPSFLETGVKLGKGDKAGAAQAFDRALKEAGSGAAMIGLGAALGSQGLVSGAYPSDPDERARWEREGISENSINIGGAWYPIPQGAGMLGLPILMGAAIGREGDTNDSVGEMLNPKNLSKLLPTDQMQGFLEIASGDASDNKVKNFVASVPRALTPAGAFFNQLAKSFDSTKNDTTTKDFWSNVLDQVGSGIPGVNNMMNIPDKTDDAGNIIKNPNAAQLALGATSASQDKGIARSAEVDSQVNDQLGGISQYGIFEDSTLEGILEDDVKKLYNQAKEGKTLGQKDVKKLQDALVKGVSSEGTDTAYLERGEYDTNLAALQLKRDLMKEDKTTKPSSLKDIDTAIKRGEVYRDNQIPYQDITDYKDTGVEEWRKMGDPEDDEYNPDMYQKLWAIDEMMTKAGVSYKKGALDKQKYFNKESKGRGGKGGGGSGAKLSTDFGTLKSGGSNAPKVREYATLDQSTGSVPVIRRTNPQIVHKIGTRGYN